MALIPLYEAKTYLRVDSSDEDALIGILLSSAEQMCKDVGRLSEDQWEAVNAADRDATLASTEVKKAVRKSAKTVKEQIQSGAPSRTGRYKESWVATKQSESSQSLQMVVHSKNRYQLAHLLEKGHAKRGGGRVAGRPHIAPAEQAGIEQLQSLIEKALK